MKHLLRFLLILGLSVSMACSEDDAAAELDEVGQQMGDAMASVDESGGTNNGTFANNQRSFKKMVARLGGEPLQDYLAQMVTPRAQAASCFLTNTFGSCTDNVIERDFQDCTILGATFSGTITLTFDDGTVDNTCSFSSEDNTVTRQPNFSMTGRRGATLAVTSTGTIGQRLTRTATLDQYLFSNDGIRRQFTDSSSTVVLDFTNITTADITVTGTSRTNRTMDGGTLQTTNNLTGQVCSFSPDNVTWDGTCNCATSGTWTGTCDGGATSADMEITGCGTGSVTIGEANASVTFDRCFEI